VDVGSLAHLALGAKSVVRQPALNLMGVAVILSYLMVMIGLMMTLTTSAAAKKV